MSMSSKNTGADSGRLPGLDVLRGVAILLVLGRHVDFNTSGGLAAALANRWLWIGWTGVDLFYAISGFLVSGLLFSEYRKYGNVKPGLFLLRRGFKIYPSFYLFLSVSVVAALAFGDSVTFRMVISEALFLRNYWEPFLPHTWSLDVEEHFYVLLAILFYVAARRRSLFWVLGPAILAVLVCPILRYLEGRSAPFDYETHFFPTHLRIDELAWGVLLSYVCHFHESRTAAVVRAMAPVLWTIGIAIFLPAAMVQMERNLFMHTGYLTALSIGSCFLIAGGLYAPFHCPRYLEPLRSLLASLGKYSYTIYLWHMLVGRVVFASWSALAWSTEPWRMNITYMALSVCCGVVSARLVEAPFLRARDRQFPRRVS